MHAATPWAFSLRGDATLHCLRQSYPSSTDGSPASAAEAAGMPALLTSGRFAHFRPHLAHDDAPITGLK
jgi:hypothetical protein